MVYILYEYNFRNMVWNVIKVNFLSIFPYFWIFLPQNGTFFAWHEKNEDKLGVAHQSHTCTPNFMKILWKLEKLWSKVVFHRNYPKLLFLERFGCHGNVRLMICTWHPKETQSTGFKLSDDYTFANITVGGNYLLN